MKKFSLGFIVGIVSLLAAFDLIGLAYDFTASSYHKKYKSFDQFNSVYKKDHPIINFLQGKTISPTLGLRDTFSGRCTNDDRRGIPRRQYFECNKLEIFISDLIYGEKE